MEIKDIDIKILTVIPKEIAYEKAVIPFKLDDKGKINVLLENEDIDLISYLSFIYKKEIKIIKETKKNIIEILDNCYGKKNKEIEMEEIIINEAIEKEASDIHFEPFQNEVLIRYRIDGRLNIKGKILREEYNFLISRIKVLANMDIAEKRKFQDGKIKYYYKNYNRDIRCSTIPTIYGEKLVLRILNKESSNLSLKKLGITSDDWDAFEKIINLKHGLVLVNGPTGSGKTTTLYSMINYLNKGDLNITTIEDPVEVYINGVNQVNVNNSIGVSFSKGLRSILRQDPDVIMVGEIRDEDTAKIAVRSAITGHKVYSTIHTSSPIEVIYRLKDMGVDPYLIVDALKGVISQRLVRRVCDKCKDVIMNEEKVEAKAVGCKECNYTGYKGRVMISEILLIEDKEKQIIRKYLNSGELEKNLIKVTMLEKAKKLLNVGIIDIKEYQDFVKGEYFNNEFNK